MGFVVVVVLVFCSFNTVKSQLLKIHRSEFLRLYSPAWPPPRGDRNTFLTPGRPPPGRPRGFSCLRCCISREPQGQAQVSPPPTPSALHTPSPIGPRAARQEHCSYRQRTSPSPELREKHHHHHQKQQRPLPPAAGGFREILGQRSEKGLNSLPGPGLAGSFQQTMRKRFLP